ncbi:MAG: AbrB/MazE/SpoVT family DNA-binding domain-containing protein [Pseudomonadota bacterium]
MSRTRARDDRRNYREIAAGPMTDGPALPALRVSVGPGGRIVIPASFRRAMNIQPGDQLVVRFVDGELRAISPAEGVRRAQRLVAKYVPRDRNLADELIAERRQEAEREDRE